MLHRRPADSSCADSDSDKSSSDKRLQRPEIGRPAHLTWIRPGVPVSFRLAGAILTGEVDSWPSLDLECWSVMVALPAQAWLGEAAVMRVPCDHLRPARRPPSGFGDPGQLFGDDPPLVAGGQGRTGAEVEDDTWGFVGLLLGTLAALAVVAAAVGVMVWVTGGGR